MTAPTFDRRGTALAFVAALALYAVSTSPTVHWGDSAELSLRALSLELSPIARGYPLHRAITWALTTVFGDAALVANATSAFFGAVSVALTYAAGVALGGRRVAGVASAAVLGLAHTYWWFAGIAEVYTLHATFLSLAILLTIGIGRAGAGRRLALGAVVGLSLLHHRLFAFAVPGIAAAVVLDVRACVPEGRRVRALFEACGGLLAGVLPFVVLCVASPRSAPPGTEDPFSWWVRDVFLGGDQNADFFLGTGAKPLAANVAYLAKWIAFNLPGPALVLVAAGALEILRRSASERALFGLLLPLHLLFPLRYDWTGDQFAFLVPFYACVAPLAGLGAARIAERSGARAVRLWTLGAAVLPVGLYACVAVTPLGELAFPRLARGRRPVPIQWPAARSEPREWTAHALDRLPRGAVLHADWGPGQVALYLQRAEGRRTDVDVRIWFRKLELLDAAARPAPAGRRPPEEWVAPAPGAAGIPAPLAAVADRLEDRGDGLFRVLPPDEGR